MTAQENYSRHIAQLRTEAEKVRGKVCVNKNHNHVMATTESCLAEE